MTREQLEHQWSCFTLIPHYFIKSQSWLFSTQTSLMKQVSLAAFGMLVQSADHTRPLRTGARHWYQLFGQS
jgi:hypothetical protein